MSRKRLLLAGWVVVLGLSATLPLSAVFHDVIHVGPGALRARTTLRNPVIALGSDVVLARGSDAVVVDVLGDIYVQGRVSDDLVALGGRVFLGASSRTNRDVLSFLGGIYRARSASVHGRLGGAVYDWNGRPLQKSRDIGQAVLNSIRLGLAAGLALLLVGTGLAIVFPWQIVLISSTLRDAPVKSIVAGILSLTTLVFLVVPLGLSLAGLPFALLLSGAAGLAWLFGLTAAAVLFGRLLSRRPVSLVWATAAGLLLLAVSMAVPVIGPLVVIAAGMSGAGALAVSLMTRSRPSVPLG